MTAPASITIARARLAECRAIVGGEHDPVAGEWRDMQEAERVFWLRLSRLPTGHRVHQWHELPGDARTILKNNLYRAARRAELILHAGGGG